MNIIRPTVIAEDKREFSPLSEVHKKVFGRVDLLQLSRSCLTKRDRVFCFEKRCVDVAKKATHVITE